MRRILLTTFALSLTLLQAEYTMVKDPAHNLMWEDTVHVEEVKLNYAQAERYCQKLTLGKHTDWRVPTLSELLTLVDYKRYKPAIVGAFHYIEKDSLYWSSTPYVRSADEYWGVMFKDGSTSNASENYDRYVRCVRAL